MKKFKCAILVAMMSLCSVLSYASDYDTDYINIPSSYINNNNSQLLEKAATIFGKTYRLTLRNISLSEYWFYCDIVIEHFDEDFDVTQQCNDEYVITADSPIIVPGTTSSIEIGQGAYDIVVHSEVRLYRDDDAANDDGKVVTVTYHFIENRPGGDDYYLVITFSYRRGTVTGIDEIDCEPLSVEYYDINGRKLNGPQPGIVIEKQGNKVTKKMYR